jgi:hypothetical protein
MSHFSHLRSSLTFANVMSSVAVFVALGGTGYAAVTVTGQNVRNSSLTGADVRNSSLTGADVRNSSLTSSDITDRSLLAVDFRAGQLPSGAQGPKGDAGPQGPQGPVGTVDTSSIYTRSESDARFVRGSGSPQLWGYIREWVRNDTNTRALPDLAGLGTLGYRCALPNTTGHGSLTFTNTASASVVSTTTIATGGTSAVVSATIAPGATQSVDLGADPTQVTWQLSPDAYFDAGALATLTITHRTGGAFCQVRVQAVTQDPVRGN